MADAITTTKVPTFCPLCVSRCGATATVADGEFVALEPDPAHPTGQALCVKGKAAPEIVRHPERLLYPLKRTRPKGDPDPGWQRITWDEALDSTAARMLWESRPVAYYAWSGVEQQTGSTQTARAISLLYALT